MSSARPGKFQDHYEVLGIDPKAEMEKIQLAYSQLAKKYHPDTPRTGNREKFDAVNQAYEVLCDPLLRREFNKLKGLDDDEGPPKFTGPEFFKRMSREGAMRSAVLSVLYDRRRTKPARPSLSVRHLEDMLQITSDELVFVLWYLKQRGLAASDDKSSLQITVDGMDHLERNMPSPEEVMPLIKASECAPERSAEPRTSPRSAESIRNLLNRDLARPTSAAKA
jgi:curved DNA-binding protein